jgi:hypothetical protein
MESAIKSIRLQFLQFYLEPAENQSGATPL